MDDKRLKEAATYLRLLAGDDGDAYNTRLLLETADHIDPPSTFKVACADRGGFEVIEVRGREETFQAEFPNEELAMEYAEWRSTR